MCIWNLLSCDCQVTFSGHKSAVTCLHFDSTNTRLVSGSKVNLSYHAVAGSQNLVCVCVCVSFLIQDTDVIVWDVIGETGLYR